MDDDDWQEMPVVRAGGASSPSGSSSEGSSRRGAKAKRIKGKARSGKYAVAQGYERGALPASSSGTFSPSTSPQKGRRAAGNATGQQLDIQDARGYNWRAKPAGQAAELGSPENESKKKRKDDKSRARKGPQDGDKSGSSSSSSDDDDDEDDGDASKGYTQLRVDDDPDAENLNAATDYLFTGAAGGGTGGIEEINATPQSQLHTTKNLLSEGQKIAYVGLVSLIAKAMIRALERVPSKEYKPAIASAEEWRLRVMARLFQHMDIDAKEQGMINSLAEHGVLRQDLAPSLVMTQTIDNPDYDPEAAAEREEEEEREREEKAAELQAEEEERELEEAVEAKKRAEEEAGADSSSIAASPETARRNSGSDRAATPPPAYSAKAAAGPSETDEGDIGSRGEDESRISPAGTHNDSAATSADSHLPPSSQSSVVREDVLAVAEKEQSGDDGDLGKALDEKPADADRQHEDLAEEAADVKRPSEEVQEQKLDPNTAAQMEPDDKQKVTPMGLTSKPQTIETLPSALEGVTTELSSADKTITLDLRWTVLCDLFLVLTADSVYDSRSRTLLEAVAEDLGLSWMDVTKFEKRVTDALEIEEGVAGSLKGKKAVRKRAEMARRRRLVMMGLATVGGGLVIGLSAGLMAPLIGAGLGAALGTVGIGGTSAFLTGAGGIAVITSTGTLSGAALAGTGMSKRTRQVKTFELKPIHNNKRVSCIIAIPGFMNSEQDDPRLPFSVIDSIMGDIFALLWEPDMMAEMGNAIYLLWNETLVQGVQQVLAATIAGGLVGALAWPLWLTKLGYFIDNPWSNALDRAHACGLILADVLSKRRIGVRPVTLVGFSLGARVIFYALVELARVKKFGIVQNVYIMGAPVTANDKTWQAARSAVSGRFVNAFSRSDWILGWLFRATTGGLGSIAGLRPVERIPDIDNVDVTQTVPGHLQYRAFMPLVLDQIGFKTTADYFDEPEDLANIPDREMVYDEPEEPQLKTVKTKTGGFGKIFRRTQASDGGSSPNPSGDERSRRGSAYDEDDLPPREDQVHSPALEPPQAERPASPTVSDKSSRPSMQQNADDEMAQILAELRESGIEVRELQSSLPPLVASPRATGPTSASSAPRTPSSLKREIQPESPEDSRAQSPEAEDVSQLDQVEQTPRPTSRQDASYFEEARSKRAAQASFKDMPSSAPSVNAGAGVALSYGDSYDDGPPDAADDSAFGDFSEAEQRYGLSQDAARELAMQFQSSGMSSSGAMAAARMAQNLESLDGSDMSITASAAAAARDDTAQPLRPPPSFDSSFGRSTGAGWGSADPWASLAPDVESDVTPRSQAARKISNASLGGSGSGSSDYDTSAFGSGMYRGNSQAASKAQTPGISAPPTTHSWDNDNPWG